MSTNSCATNHEDKYSVHIHDGFMKVSMPLKSNDTSVHDDSTSTRDKEPPTTSSSIPNSTKSSEKVDPPTTKIPDTVLQFQRQLRKTQAAKRASTPLLKSQLQIIHDDKHIVVVNKPSGVLTVPGINSNPSMLTLLHEEYHANLDPEMKREHMIVHRLDMDTSGVVIYAKTRQSMSNLQASFREREVEKCYEALVCGHINLAISKGMIDLPLQRDHRFPPFMRVATPRSEREAKEVVKDLKNAGWKKIVKKNAKPSQTLFEVLEREYVCADITVATTADDNVDENGNRNGGVEESSTSSSSQGKRKKKERFPVTRVKLTPVTGRTHQLRVHCAAIGHPILGDPTYGIYGEAAPNGGFENDILDELIEDRASVDLQLSLDQYAKDVGQVMCLHARQLQVKHPVTGERMVFEQPPAF